MVSNVNFREQLRRVFSNNRPRGGHTGLNGDMQNERAPLLPDGEATRETVKSWWHHLTDTEHITGQDSDYAPVRWAAHSWKVTKVSLLSSPVNVLLPFVPLGIVAGKLEWSPTAVFTLNFFGIIPLAAVLSFATENLAAKMGDTIGGLVNATFGNAVELIVSIIALRAGEIEVVQSSMLGSILSNLLLVMGMCFFLGGIFNMNDGSEQSFMSGTAQTTCSLMALSSGSLVLPAALYNSLTLEKDEDREETILLLSRGTAVVLLVLYGLFLYFQIVTHKKLFDEKHNKPKKPAVGDEEAALTGTNGQGNGAATSYRTMDSISSEGDAQDSEDEEGEEEPVLGVWSALAALVVVTLIISVCADYLVDSIDAIVATGHISKTFIGLILIPIVGNAAEHVTACVVAVKDKMDMAMGVAIGSSIQIALLVTPALVILGWAMGQPMTLHFDTFETIAFAFSVIIVASMVQDGRSNYLEGAMLMGFYVIIALAFWASPPGALGHA